MGLALLVQFWYGSADEGNKAGDSGGNRSVAPGRSLEQGFGPAAGVVLSMSTVSSASFFGQGKGLLDSPGEAGLPGGIGHSERLGRFGVGGVVVWAGFL